MNKFTAIYLRVSTNIQSNGLQAQERAIEQFCKSNNIIDYQIFKDEGFSGTLTSRPALDEMMLRVRENKIERVIVYSFSRFARSTRHLLDALDEFNRNEVKFISLSENIDTSSSFGKAIFSIVSAISELERDLIAERVKNGLVNARAKGKVLGRPKKRNGELIHVLKEQGLTYRKIAQYAKCSVGSVHRELAT